MNFAISHSGHEKPLTHLKQFSSNYIDIHAFPGIQTVRYSIMDLNC